jgi:hypothetical protein
MRAWVIVLVAGVVVSSAFPLLVSDAPTSLGLPLDGVGAITSNGETRLIYDYPEPVRSQILDWLFTPALGLGIDILKIELGSAVQSTLGTEAAPVPNRGEQPSCTRGIQYWYAFEARRRNPAVKIAVLQWSAPGWVGGNGSFFSSDDIEIVVAFLQCLEGPTWNVSAQYIGIWNEPPVSEVPPSYLKALRSALDAAGFAHVQIDATDTGSGASASTALVADLHADAELRDAVPIVGLHHPCGALPEGWGNLTTAYGIRPWSSEDYSLIGDEAGAACWAGTPGRNWLSANVTASIAWGAAFSAYPNVICINKGFIYATHPYTAGAAGQHYTLAPSMWAMAAWTWFTDPGWTFLQAGPGGASTFLPPGSNATTSVVTLVSPADPSLGGARDFTMVLTTQACNASVSCFSSANNSAGVLAVTVEGGPALRAQAVGAVSVWLTNASAAMMALPPVPVTCAPASAGVSAGVTCTFTLPYEPGGVYSVTTLQVVPGTAAALAAAGVPNASSFGGAAGFPLEIDVGVPDVFPLGYGDDFEGFAPESYGRFFTDWDGSFQVLPDPSDPTKNSVLRARVLQPPIRWHCADVDPITFIAPGYANYEVSVAVRIDANETRAGRRRGAEDAEANPGLVYSRGGSLSPAAPAAATTTCGPTHVACDATTGAPVEPYVALVFRINKPASGWCPVQTGYALQLFGNGTWALVVWPGNAFIRPQQLVLASGTVRGSPVDAWHTLGVSAYGTSLQIFVDGTDSGTVTDATFDHGLVGLASGYHFSSFDAFSFVQTGPAPAANLVLTAQYMDGGATASFAGLAGLVVVPRTASSTLAGLCRFAALGSSRVHNLYVIRARDNATLASAVVDMHALAPQQDPFGFSCARLGDGSGSLPLALGERYYLVSDEVSGGDPHYGVGPPMPCSGDRTVRSPVLGVRAAFAGLFDFPGSVQWTMLGGWVEGGEGEARSLGPVNFLIVD